MLDEFSAPPKFNVEKRQEDSSRSTHLSSSLGGQDAPQQKQPAGHNPEDELSKHIEAGMAELLGELESSVSLYGHDTQSKSRILTDPQARDASAV